MAARMVSAIARTIPTVAGFSAMCPLLVPGCRIFIGNNRRRCVSYFTLRWLSKKCNFEPRVEHPVRTQHEVDLRAQKEARWSGEKIDADVVVYGWLDPTGKLWKVGTEVEFDSPMV